MNIKVDFSALKKWQAALHKNEADETIKAALQEAVALAMRGTKQKTPVITGTLRREWKITNIIKKGNVWEVQLYNDTKYAMYVEYGHRTRLNRLTGTRRFVAGRYMMKISCDEVERNMQGIVQKHLDRFYRSIGYK